MKLKIITIAHHRNGIDGAPFDVALFEDPGPEGSRKVAILFHEPHYCAVLDVAKLAQGDIAFGSNSWRGDQYEPELRKAIPASPDEEAEEEIRKTHYAHIEVCFTASSPTQAQANAEWIVQCLKHPWLAPFAPVIDVTNAELFHVDQIDPFNPTHRRLP